MDIARSRRGLGATRSTGGPTRMDGASASAAARLHHLACRPAPRPRA